MKTEITVDVTTSINGNKIILMEQYGDKYYGIDRILTSLRFIPRSENFSIIEKITELVKEHYPSPYKEMSLEKLKIENTYNVLPHNFFIIREFYGEELADKVCDLYNANNKNIVDKFILDNNLIRYEGDGEAVFIDTPHNTEAVVIVNNYILAAVKIYRGECSLINLHRHI